MPKTAISSLIRALTPSGPSEKLPIAFETPELEESELDTSDISNSPLKESPAPIFSKGLLKSRASRFRPSSDSMEDIEITSSIPTKRRPNWDEFNESPIRIERIQAKKRILGREKVFSAPQNSPQKAIQLPKIEQVISEAIRPLIDEIKSLKLEIISLKEANSAEFAQISSKISANKEKIAENSAKFSSSMTKSASLPSPPLTKIAEKAIQKSQDKNAKKTFAEIAKLNSLVEKQSEKIDKIDNWTLIAKKKQPINKELAPKKGLKVEDRRILFLREKSARPMPNIPNLLLAINLAIKNCGLPTHIRLLRLWVTPLGAISGTMGEGASADMLKPIEKQVLEAAKTVDSSILSFQASEQWYSLRIHTIPLNRYLNPNGMRVLKQEIEAITDLNLPYMPRWINKNRAEERYINGEIRYSSIIITVRSKAVADKLIAQGVDFGGKNHSAELFIEAKHDKICLKCSEFGHNSLKKCQKDAKCYICGQKHEASEHKCSVNGCTAKTGTKCTHIPTKCVNCEGNHLAISSYCPKRLDIVQNRRNMKKLQQIRPEIAVIIPPPSKFSQKENLEKTRISTDSAEINANILESIEEEMDIEITKTTQLC